MLRVRFHGRGGHGVKTASRILGTAAFLAGLQAQDSPLYGAERRGAALAAFTSIDREPICERGVVLDPDLIVIADETLLADPATGVLVGQEFASAIFVNSLTESDALARQHAIFCPVQAMDLTAVTTDVLGRGSALSAPLGAIACALARLGPLDRVLAAVRQELEELGLSESMIGKNLQIAERVYPRVAPALLRRRPDAVALCAMHRPVPLASAEGIPIISVAGNATARHTGSWRIFRPVIDRSACTRCQICVLCCPDAAMNPDARGVPLIDYDNCKGCMICSRECPVKCIQEEKEVRAW